MQLEWMLVAVSIIIRRRRTPVIGRVSAGPRKRQDRHPVDSRTPVIGRVSAGPIAMQKTLLQELIETFLQYNDVANQRKKNISISSNNMHDELGNKA